MMIDDHPPEDWIQSNRQDLLQVLFDFGQFICLGRDVSQHLVLVSSNVVNLWIS
jgi:hypothetical protein